MRPWGGNWGGIPQRMLGLMRVARFEGTHAVTLGNPWGLSWFKGMTVIFAVDTGPLVQTQVTVGEEPRGGDCDANPCTQNACSICSRAA